MGEGIEDVASGTFHHDKGSRILLIVGLCSIVLALILFVGAFLYAQKAKNVWNPLGDYPIQTVNPKVIHLNETVNSTAHKCAKEDGVKVRFQGVTWRAVTAGIVIGESNPGEARRYKSCGPTPKDRAYTFHNYVPQAIQDLVRAKGPSLWYITSVDTPVRSNGEEGTPRSWSTETFKLVP